MSQTINFILKYFTVWLDGHGLMAEGHSCKLPKLSIKMEDFRAGGMDSPFPVDLGVERMECDFKLYSFNPDIMSKWGLLAGQTSRLTFRSHLEGTGGQTNRMRVIMDAHMDDMDFGNWDPGKVAENQYRCKVSYYKVMIDDREVIEIDSLGFKRAMNGVDQLQAARINLGM